MGVVYKATDPHLGRPVAIKMMTLQEYANNPEMLQRFYREAKSTGNLHHPNIVTIYELGDQDGSPYLVMEFLEGQTLDAVIRSRQPLTLLERIDFILEVCEGLAYAHERSVIHRDIKPGNIMVLANAGVKIVDFGIAHIGNRTVTRTGQLLGSLSYMSTEQISGNPVDGRSDIFSLGIVFYQLLTSELPFEGGTPAATLWKIMHEQPRRLADYNHSYPPELDDVILRALAKDRDQRYATAQEFAFDLRQVRSRIQQEVVDEHLNEAESLLLQGELLKTQDKLSHVLKIDRYNTKAVELSRITQQRRERQEIGQRVGELRRQAEEAYRQDQFVAALDLIQQALNLHSTDPDLQRLRLNVQQSKTRAERLQRTIERAELAYQQGELESAKQAVEEALALSPDDTQAKKLHDEIQRDWEQRARRLQVEGLIEEARREIASRNFTLALKVLHSAEAIDPGAPELKALIEAAQTAREQEQRRKAIEASRHEIETALDRDDFDTACSKAQEAIQKFPDERSLEKLAELAEKQRSLAKRKRFIDEHLVQARKLLEQGHIQEALAILQSAQEKTGGDPHIESLLGVVRETFERQRVEARKSDYLRRAKDLLRRKEYAECIAVLEEAQSALGHNSEIDDLLHFAIDQSNAERRRKIADAAAEKARMLIENHDYANAVTVLEEALREAPDEELRLILVQARHAASDHRKRLDDTLANADSMMQGQRPVEALTYLRSQPSYFSRDPRFVEFLEQAERRVERLNNIERELEKVQFHLRRDEYDQARSVASEGAHLYGDSAEFSKLLSEINEREAQFVAESIETAIAEARHLIVSGTPEASLDRLSALENRITALPGKFSATLSALRQEAMGAIIRKYKTKIEQLLAEGEHEEAGTILQNVLAEYPGRRELQQLKKALDQAVQRRMEAQNQVSRAEDCFQRGAWREGAEKCLHAAPFSIRDPFIRGALLNTLERAASNCVAANWREAEYLLQCMKGVQPSIVLPSEIVQRIERSKQDESIQECLSEAHEFQVHEEFDKALNRVEIELERYPQDSRLSDLKRSLQHHAEERTLGDAHKQAYIDDIERRVRDESRPDRRIQILEEALRAYPDEATFTRELSAQQTLWRSVTLLVEEAHTHERSKRYEQAIQRWHAIRELKVTHPDLETSLTRLNVSKQYLGGEVHSASTGKQQQFPDLTEASPKQDERQSPAVAEQRKTNSRNTRIANRTDNPSRLQVQEPAPKPVRHSQISRPSVQEVLATRKESQPDTNHGTKIWHGSALPVHISQSEAVPTQLFPAHVGGLKAQASSPSKPQSSRKRITLYAGAVACIVAAILLGSIIRKDTNRTEVSPSAPIATAPSSPAFPSVTRTAIPPAVRLEVRDGKPNSEVLVDNKPKGKIDRHGTFSAELSPGDHQIHWMARNKLSGTVNRHFAGDAPVHLTASDLAPVKSPEASSSPNADQTDWQRVKDSQTPADIERFLAQYPNSNFASEAQTRLESLYWNSAAGERTINGYGEYIARYPQGTHAQQAREDIAEIEWRSVENSSDAASLDAFAKKHPAGNYHDQAVIKLDEIIWRRTQQNDAASLRLYLQNFPEGHHASEARRQIEELGRTASAPPMTTPVAAAPPPADGKKAVLEVLGLYRKAYEERDLIQLREIWPGMSSQQVKSLGDFFAHASELSLEYRVLGAPTFEADHATVTFQQSLRYVANGKPAKDLATVTIRLNRSPESPGRWLIDSIR